MRSRAEATGSRRRLLAVAAMLAATSMGCSDDGTGPARTVVEVFGPVVGEPGQRLADALAAVSEGSPVELRYVGVTSFNEQLGDRLASGDRPGIALLPQPGLLGDLAARGVLQPLPADVAATIPAQFPSALVDLVTVDEKPAAVWLTVDVKGLVWYRPSEFTERGYAVPTTLDELGELSERIRTADDAVAPWCLTMEAGGSTGWVGTDWVEDYTIRRLGPAQYDRWTEGTLPFDSPQIAAVFGELDELLRSPGATAGGSRAVLTAPWERSAALLLDGSPTCLMAHQADFLRREFPSGTSIGPDGDVDFFVLPSADATAAPMLLGGMLAAPLRQDDAVSTAMQLVASSELAERLNATTEFLSPHLAVDRDNVGDATSRRLLDLLATTDDLRFDGSDVMPAAVGTEAFWQGMRAFFAGEELAPVLAGIDAMWPAAEQS